MSLATRICPTTPQRILSGGYYHERKERKRTYPEPYLRRKDATPRTAGVLEEQMTFPNMKESGLYGRSLFACLQKRKKRPRPLY